jgi:hypothetical protein
MGLNYPPIHSFHTLSTTIVPISIHLDNTVIVTMVKDIRHLSFRRIGRTEYSMVATPGIYNVTLHTGQIEHFLAFDKALREGRTMIDLPGIPMGYEEFA